MDKFSGILQSNTQDSRLQSLCQVIVVPIHPSLVLLKATVLQVCVVTSIFQRIYYVTPYVLLALHSHIMYFTGF